MVTGFKDFKNVSKLVFGRILMQTNFCGTKWCVPASLQTRSYTAGWCRSFKATTSLAGIVLTQLQLLPTHSYLVEVVIGWAVGNHGFGASCLICEGTKSVAWIVPVMLLTLWKLSISSAFAIYFILLSKFEVPLAILDYNWVFRFYSCILASGAFEQGISSSCQATENWNRKWGLWAVVSCPVKDVRKRFEITLLCC